MPIPSAAKKQSRLFSPISEGVDPSQELRFISDLGRSLLFTVHPKKVASRVAGAIQKCVEAEVCAFVVELENIGIVSCAFDERGEIDPRTFSKSRFEKWLEFMPPQIGYRQEDEGSFLLSGSSHQLEYVSPLHINGEIKGAIVVGFAAKRDFNDAKGSLIDAATQMAAMSVNLSAHYEAAINNSINRAKEEHRRFTEAVLDALPVSLYVVDRDFRIVTWNKHREIGVQGIPRDSALGRNVFNVLARTPEGRVREEFERAFRTGKIERIEQQTAAEDGSTKHWMVSKDPIQLNRYFTALSPSLVERSRRLWAAFRSTSTLKCHSTLEEIFMVDLEVLGKGRNVFSIVANIRQLIVRQMFILKPAI